MEIWILNTIRSNPEMFGGHLSNPSIMLQYIKEFHPDIKAENLTLQMMSALSTVSRAKNKLLKKYPLLDQRKRIQLSFEV